MKFARCVLFLVLALMFSGCAGYHVGSSLDKSLQTISLKIVNRTDEPSIEGDVMKALRAELQMDGRLEVRSEDEADVSLTVILTRFDLGAISYVRDQDSLASEYRMTLAGTAVLRHAESDEVILESPMILGQGDFPYATDLTTTKRGALPEAASDLARKVVSTVVAAW